MEKKVIWSNMDLDIKDWKEGYKEFLEANEIEDKDPEDEDAIYDWMIETNANYLMDEYLNLDKEVEGRILVIADLGLWNGRKQGYYIFPHKNLKYILNHRYDYGYDYAEFYSDGYNIRGTEVHHDGTNYYLYRAIREDRNIDNLLTAIYNGEEISPRKLNYYTRSLHKDVAKIYGW
jgi:hypothetical protein